MMVKWPDLMAEFDCWEEAGKVATLWWRDDDAVAPTARLGRLLSTAPGVPLALAVIPADAQQELAQWLAQHAAISAERVCCGSSARLAACEPLGRSGRRASSRRNGQDQRSRTSSLLAGRA